MKIRYLFKWREKQFYIKKKEQESTTRKEVKKRSNVIQEIPNKQT